MCVCVFVCVRVCESVCIKVAGCSWKAWFIFFSFSLWTGAVGHGGDPTPGGGLSSRIPLCVCASAVSRVFLVSLLLPQFEFELSEEPQLCSPFLTLAPA